MKERWYRLLTWLPAKYQTLSPGEALRGQVALGAARAGPAARLESAAPTSAAVTPFAASACPTTFSVAVQWGAAQNIVLGQAPKPRSTAPTAQPTAAPSTVPAQAPYLSVDDQLLDSQWEAPESGPNWYGEPPEAQPTLLAAPTDPADWEPYETLDDAALAAYESSAESDPGAFAQPEAAQVPSALPAQLGREHLRERGHQTIMSGVQQARASMLN